MITLNSYKDQLVGVFGLGESGLATLKALAAGGAKMVAWDDSAEKRKSAEALGLDVRFDPVKKWPWDHISIVVLSPGIPLTYPKPHEIVTAAKQHCCPVVGDIELLYQACPHATYVAITGTNGKSTTTALVGHMFKTAGKRVEVGGNIGTAALSLEPLSEGEIYVLELSSYQLDLLATSRFDISVLLNISHDHIDRHGSIDGYVAAKSHIFDHQTEHDTAIIGVDDAYTRGVVEDIRKTPAKLVKMTTMQEDADIRARDGVLLDQNANISIDLNDMRHLQGQHNWQNAAAAYAIASALKLSTESIEEAFRTFPGLEHRMELVAEKGGIIFINDSKATNANATSHALGSWENIYWIAGGVAKDGGIDTLSEYHSRIKRAYLIGQSQESFANTLAGDVIHTECDTLEKALAKVMQDIKAESVEQAVVMLSPAAASFDQYKNFEQRGDHFKQLVWELSNHV